MPTLKHDDVLLRLIRDVNDIRANLRRIVANLPLYDIANENIPAQLTANQNNYVPGNFDILMLSSSQAVTITGVANGVKGRKLQIFNIGSYPIVLPYESPNSLAKNRFRFQSGLPSAIRPGNNVTLYYYSSIQRWISGTELFDWNGDWSLGTMLPGDWYGVAWSPALEIFVAVGNQRVAYSSDGIAWNLGAGAPVKYWNCVSWIPMLDMFIAGANLDGYATDNMAYSIDGMNWNPITTPIPAYDATAETTWKRGYNGFSWSDNLGLLVAVGTYVEKFTGASRPLAASSTDGINWTDRTPVGLGVTDGFGYDVDRSDDIGYYATADNGKFGGKISWYSQSGTLWTLASSTSLSPTAIAASDNIFVIFRGFGATSNSFYTSIDGKTWVLRSSALSSSVGVNKAIWVPELNMFMAVGVNNSMYSTDGLTWYIGASTPAATWNSVTWSQKLSKFVAVGSGGKVMSTPY